MFCATTRGMVTEFPSSALTPPSISSRSNTPSGTLCWIHDSADTGGEGPESEDGQDSNPYPLEGKYVDEVDRQKCVFPPSRTRHHAQRLNHFQGCSRCPRLNAKGSSSSDWRKCSVSKTHGTWIKWSKPKKAVRQKPPPRFQNVRTRPETPYLRDLPVCNTGSQAARGWNKEKSQRLDEYKAKRLAKGDKKKVGRSRHLRVLCR